MIAILELFLGDGILEYRNDPVWGQVFEKVLGFHVKEVLGGAEVISEPGMVIVFCCLSFIYQERECK
jgi:hypothetical protein